MEKNFGEFVIVYLSFTRDEVLLKYGTTTKTKESTPCTCTSEQRSIDITRGGIFFFTYPGFSSVKRSGNQFTNRTDKKPKPRFRKKTEPKTEPLRNLQTVGL